MGQSIHSMMDDPSLLYDHGTGTHLQHLYQSCQSSLDIYGQGYRLSRPARDGPSMPWAPQPTTGEYGAMSGYGSMGQGSIGQYGFFPQTSTAQYGSVPQFPSSQYGSVPQFSPTQYGSVPQVPPTQPGSGFSQFAGGSGYGGGSAFRAFYMGESGVGRDFPTSQFQPYTHTTEAAPSFQMPLSYQDTYGFTHSQSVPGLDDFQYPVVEEVVEEEGGEEDMEEDEEDGEEEEGGEEEEDDDEDEDDDEEGGDDEGGDDNEDPGYEIRHDPTHQRLPQTQQNTRPKRTIIRPRCGTGGHKFH